MSMLPSSLPGSNDGGDGFFQGVCSIVSLVAFACVLFLIGAVAYKVYIALVVLGWIPQ